MSRPGVLHSGEDRRRPLRIWGLALLVATLGALAIGLAGVAPTRAQTVNPATTTTFVGTIPSPMSGDSFEVSALLRAADGTPVVDATIEFTIGEQVRRARTAADGIATLKMSSTFVAGTYDVLARFEGAQSRSLGASENRTTLTIQPIPVRVTTVPPVPGVRFALGVDEIVTGADGVAVGSVAVAANYDLAVLSTEGAIDSDNPWRFKRWRDGTTETTRVISLPADRSQQVGMQLLKRVNISIRDTRGTPVDPQALSSLTLRLGRDETLNARTRSLLVAVNEVAATPEGLAGGPAVYQTADIAYPGIPPFNLATQRFSIGTHGTNWTIQVPTVVSVELEKQQGVSGKPFNLAARVRMPGGAPVADVPVVFEFEGRTAQARSDEQGLAQARVSTPLGTGDYPLTARVTTTSAAPYASVATRSTISVVPVLFRLQTVPPIAGVPVIFDGREYQTDEAGALAIGLELPGEYEVTVPAEGHIDERTRWSFRRWEPGASEVHRTVVLPDEGELQLGLEVQKLISFKFHDLKQATVAFDQIESLTVKSSVGDSVVLRPTDVFWMRANNVSKDSTGLFASPVLYSISEVLMSGSNVVNQGQQRIIADDIHGEPWSIEVRLFDLRIASHDRLFGFPMGSAIILEDAAGNVTEHAMTGGEVTLLNLPRGEYKVRIVAPGLELIHTVVVTRPTDVGLDVLSYVDIAFVGAFGLFCVIVPLVLGTRRFWIRRQLAGLVALAGRATSLGRR